LRFNTPTVFNAALNFRLHWDGRFRSLEEQGVDSFENVKAMGVSMAYVVETLAADESIRSEFLSAYGRAPNADDVLDALSTFERSLLTPGSRFDRYLRGESAALSQKELDGYSLFKSLGCVACHQGVNIGGNLFAKPGVFSPLTQSPQELLRVPSLRNVAVTPPYFHDGSAATLDVAIRKMGRAQLNTTLTDDEVTALTAFLGTLTGFRDGRQVGATP
jgi:cytochrome c peroxidase